MASPKYQSIEGFGQSLLAKEDARIARARKDVRKVRGARVLLGIGNAALAARAQERATEVWNSGQEQLTQANDYLNTGLQFWEDHQNMLGDKFAPENWKEAYTSRYYENYLASKGLTKAEANTEESIAQLEADLKNDLSSYEKRMKLAEQFKLSGSETVEEKKTAFLSPIMNSLESRVAREESNSKIIPAIMNAIGGRKGPSADEQSAKAYLDSIFQQNATWDEATKQWESSQADNKMMEVLRGKEPDVDVKEVYFDPTVTRLATTYAESDKLDNDEIVIELENEEVEFEGADFGSQFSNEDQAKLWEQAGFLASAAKYKYNNAVELGAEGGYESEGLKTDVQFLQSSVDYLIREGRVTPASKMNLFKSFNYNAYSELELSDIVNQDVGFFDSPVFDNVTPKVAEILKEVNPTIAETTIGGEFGVSTLIEESDNMIGLLDILEDIRNNNIRTEEHSEIRELTQELIMRSNPRERREQLRIAEEIYKELGIK